MKLANATIAIALAVLSTQAFAGQQLGRDSVYASTARTGSASPAGVADRHGRDSVYAMGNSVQGTPVQSVNADVLKRHGRA